ncbi:phosphotransferase [Bacillus sp. REN10]|uniref:phosphotransferase n=1 Tax=Bacillus sp. REN10 TaxID=2782541 RepID=UPI00193B7C61|nr:phosphotransferase [Bacillus sp. REN10]
MRNKATFGDAPLSRLLFQLSAALGEEIDCIYPIKTGKWVVYAGDHQWFLKRYGTQEQFMKQWKLTEKLLSAKFYSIIPFHSASPIIIEKNIFALMPFIKASKRMYTFQSRQEREEALQLLSSFHTQTKTFVDELNGHFPPLDQLTRWRQRLNSFIQLSPQLQHYFPKSLLERYIEMGKWSLTQLMKRTWRERKPVIIHGDIVAHNFLRAEKGPLFLIDFDLAMKAPAMYDYLQFANRVLPLVDWDLDPIMEHGALAEFKEDEEFYLQLLFPTDIFRECRRFIHSISGDYQHTYDLTVTNFQKREAFFVKWQNELA